MKLFVTDYDGTLFTSEKQIKTTIKKLEKLRERNILVVIATGRGYPSIKNQTIIYNIPYDYLICADGSIIYNKDNNIEKMFCMNKDIIKPFEEFYQTLNYEEIQFSYPTGFSNILRNDINELLGINICISTDIYNNEMVNRFIEMGKSYPKYNFLNYMHPNYSYLCVKPKGISKSYAIKYLIEKLNILKNDVYVIGDSSNDYEMIKDFNGSCISTSSPEVLAIAKSIYKNIDDYINDILKEND